MDAMRVVTMIGAAAALCLGGLRAVGQGAERPVPQPRSGPSVYFPEDIGTRSWCFSTGDALAVVDMFPVETELQMRQTITHVDDLFNISRILWRGCQNDRIFRPGTSVVYEDDFFGLGPSMVKWAQRGMSRKAAAMAKERGVAFWGFDTLTDMGYMPWVDAGKGFGPFAHVMKLLYDNPHWMPRDRIGLRRAGCALSYAYPEARRALVEDYDAFLTENPYYDGVWFYTYVETFDQQFEDEFGYEEPIVEEFRKRYGVDIRTQPFDKQKWYDLKGELFTELMRELSAVFRKHGKKLAITLDPTHMAMPVPWLAGGGVRAGGRFTVDWRLFVREGLVDELSIFCVGSEDFYWRAYQELAASVKGTPVKISVYNSRPLPERWKAALQGGVDRVIQDNPFLHEGYPGKRPIEDIASDDPYAKLNVLTQIQGMGPANFTGLLMERMSGEEREAAKVGRDFILQNIVPLLKDPNALVARQAAKTLGDLKEPAALATLERAVVNGSNAVQCMCMRALRCVNGPNSVAAIRDALARSDSWLLHDTAERSLGAMTIAGKERLPEILRECRSPNERVRLTFVKSFFRGRVWPEAEPVLLEALNGGSRSLRYGAAHVLAGSKSPIVYQGLLKMARGSDIWLAQRAALSLASCWGTRSAYSAPVHREIVSALRPAFARCGSGAEDSDGRWAWRPIGNALHDLGPAGKDALRDVLLGNDRVLAEHAWECLYARVDGWGWKLIPEATRLAQYAHAPGRPGFVAPPPFSETKPVRVGDGLAIPFLTQDFDGWSTEYTGRFGDDRTKEGRWYSPGNPPKPRPQSLHARSGNAIELTRSQGKPCVLEGHRYDYYLDWQNVLLSCWIEIPHANASIFVGMKPYNSWETIGITVTGDGEVEAQPGRLPRAKATKRMFAMSWCRVGILYHLAARTMRVMTGETLGETVMEDVALPPDATMIGFIACVQSPEWGKAFLDDVQVTFDE